MIIGGGVRFGCGAVLGDTPVPVVGPDSRFNYVTALFYGNGANAAQNNTFIDSSTANSGSGFTITRNGTPTQGSFSPYGSYWSNYFNGSSDLTVPDNAALQLSTGSFTFEAWIYLDSAATGTDRQIFSNWGSGAESYQFYLRSANLRFSWQLYTQNSPDTAALAITPFTWTHIAVCRSGTTVTTFINGVLADTTTSVTNSANGTGTRRIGAASGGGSNFSGYISNLRIVKGTAVYTGAFTTPTGPLAATQSSGVNISAITGTSTSLLTCQSNQFIDNSSTALAVTILTGTPSVQRFNPFGNGQSSYSTSVIGSSGYFKGSSDYLTIPYSASHDIPSSTTVCFEAWVYTNSSTTFVMADRNWGYGGGGPTWAFYLLNGITPEWGIAGTGSATFTMATSTLSGKLGQWNHYAFTRDASNVVRIFVNGAVGVSRTDSQAMTSASGGIYVGVSTNLASPYANGYMSNVRFVVGSAVYTGAFTPPTVPLTAITNTTFLLNFTNAGIYDSAAMNNVVTAGSAQISTAQVKYGTGSLSFNGTTDYLSVPASPSFAFGTGDFTVEYWFYQTSVVTNEYEIWESQTSSAFIIYKVGSSGALSWRPYGSTDQTILAHASIPINTWTHVAVSRASGTTKAFVNGVQVNSVADSTTYVTPTVVYTIGGRDGGSNYFPGYIDDFRVTKGYARYTSAFTPPTAQLSDR
jgi:hypothetical protein